MSHLVAVLPKDFNACEDSLWYGPQPDSNLMRLDFCITNVRLVMTEEQRKEKKRKYRQEYNARPENKVKAEERSKSEEEKQRRKAYSKRPKVKAKKKRKTTIDRIKMNLLKEDKVLNAELEAIAKERYHEQHPGDASGEGSGEECRGSQESEKEARLLPSDGGAEGSEV